MIKLDEVLKYLEENGSSWMPIPDEETFESDLEKRVSNNVTYITHHWFKTAEQECSQIIASKVKKIKVDVSRIDEYIKEYEYAHKLFLADEQKEAVRMMATEMLCILTGGPGTGKTSVIKCAVYVIKRLNANTSICFTAPTGKAARRIKEGTGFEATTIQKKIHDTGLLGNILEDIWEDVCLVDEASMIDLEVFYKLTKCLSSHTRLILIGDVDQLPSVGEGSILRDLLNSNYIPAVMLEKTFRQDNSSKLYENIQIVKKGCNIPLEEGEDFKRFKETGDIFKLCVDRYMENIKVYGIEQTVLLSPYRKAGNVCSKKLNSYLQRRLNPDGIGFKTKVWRDDGEEWIEFKVGDPVINLRNNTRIANGDTGRILYIGKGIVKVKFSDCTYIYNVSKQELNDLDLAYALSVNKSQGSEYKCVIVPFLKEHDNLSRNMIYTAISRATGICEVIGDDEVIQEACKLQAAMERCSFLSEEIELSMKQKQMITNLLQA